MQTTTVTIKAGDYIYVRFYSPADRKSRALKKARLEAYMDYEGSDGRMHLGALVTYTSDTGEPFSYGRRARGETEVVSFDRVLPRMMPSGVFRVEFQYDRDIAAYEHTGTVATASHVHPNHEGA